MDLLNFSYGVELLLDWRFYLGLIFSTVIIIFGGLKVQNILDKRNPLIWDKFEKIMKEKSIKRVEDIPYNRYLPFWTPTWFFEGLTAVYKVLWDGIPFIDPVVLRNGPIVRAHLLFYEVFVIADISLAQKMLISGNPVILNKPRAMYKNIFVEWLENGLLASSVEVWQPHRKILSFCFTYKALATYSKVMDKHGKALAKALEDNCTDGTIRGDLMVDLISKHSIKIIAEIVLGTKSSVFLDCDGFFNVFKKGKKLLISKVTWENLMKPLWRFTKQKKEYDRCKETLKGFIRKDVATYKEEMEGRRENKEDLEGDKDGVEGERPFRSVIEQMLEFSASEREIYDEVGTFMSAGHETTSGAIQFFLQHMGENPEVQDKCREEVDKLSEGLSMEDISNMKYLERCILESLRITPTVPFFLRECSEDYEVEGLRFKNGTKFAFAPWVMHNIPEFFPEPEKFNPDRWLKENMKEGGFYAFMPFSHGPRNCIGFKFAVMEMKVILSWVLRHFIVSTEDRWKDVKLDFEVTMVPRRNYKIVLTKRENIH